MQLRGQVAWVVGASSGIGATVARELVSRGANVAVSARREEQLHDVSQGSMLVVPADVTDADSIASAASTVRNALGPIDLVVLCAGYWKQMNAAAWDTDVFDQHLRVNLTGISNTLAAILPPMLERRRGVIAGISSVAGYRGLAGSEAYGATKAGQLNLLESLRVHVARRGVRVTTICPGFVRTDLTAGNRFPMPFIIDADEAGIAICDGLEHDRTEIVFPLPMALLMKAARLIPPRLWTALWSRGALTEHAERSRHTHLRRNPMRIKKTITVDKPLETVFDYLCDFTTTTEWDPGTVQTVRESGDGGVGTKYLNTSRFLGRETQLTYIVHDLHPHRRIQLRGENTTLIANDTMTFTRARGGTEVTYTADFTFKGVTRFLAPLLRPAFRRLGDQAAAGMRSTLTALPDPRA